MKPSEMVLSKTIEEQTPVYIYDILKILDAMAEDIQFLKKNMNNPFTFLAPTPVEREWEKEWEKD